MSFILDALKRAEAERDQGAVPGLMTQHDTATAQRDGRDPDDRTSATTWALLGLGLLIAALLLWMTIKPEAAPIHSAMPPLPTPPAYPSASPEPPRALPAPAADLPAPRLAGDGGDGGATGRASVLSDQAQFTPQGSGPTSGNSGTGADTGDHTAARSPAEPPAARAPSPAARTSVNADTAGAPTPSPAEPGAQPAAPRLSAKARAAAAAASAAASAAAATAAAATPAEKLPTLADLSAELRGSLPALSVGGAIHSKNAADRLLIVNGLLVHEGDVLAPGLVLERIRLKSAVLRFKGMRFELPY